MNYESFKESLDNIKLGSFYIKNIAKRQFSIEYNKNSQIQVSSVLEAGENYSLLNRSRSDISIDEQVCMLEQHQAIDSRDLLLKCIEIFDWGEVQKSNILSAFKLHREDKLETYLQEVKAWFEDDTNLIEPSFTAFWSSGWTKVYSFFCSSVTIYDSRVAAFINQVLKEFWDSSNQDIQSELKKLSSGLLTFGGNETSSGNYRLRILDKNMVNNLELYKNPTEKRKMLANKKASWFIRYLSEHTFDKNTQENFRALDKSAFMLGFDLNQW